MIVCLIDSLMHAGASAVSGSRIMGKCSLAKHGLPPCPMSGELPISGTITELLRKPNIREDCWE